MLDEIQIQCCDAYEIAEALINKEVSLVQLESVPIFAAKARLVEEAVWELCKSENSISRYLKYHNIYPYGIHACEVDDWVWAWTQEIQGIGGYDPYLIYFPNGIHAEEAKKYKAMEEEAWQMAKCIDTLESYRHYMDSYPQGLHITEAHHRINDIVYEQKERIIQELCEDRNAYHLNYIKACGITVDDLKGKIKDSKGQVRDEVLKSWNDIPEVLLMDTMPTHLPQGVPEVYVWGLPKSGKTCALATILSTANMMGCLEPCNGYVMQLSTLFIPKREKPAVCLPVESNIDTTRYLPITLNEIVTDRKGEKTIKRHNLSVIEISGDIFECFSCELQGEPFKSQHSEEIYGQLKAFLSSTDNPKYHFFILDGDRMQNSVQLNYWQRAAYYFQKGGVFNKATQGISLILTKSDLLSPNRSEWIEYAKDYIMRYYAWFVNALKRIVGPHGLMISDGKFKVIPFSIGEVFFQDLCIFNPETAKVLVDELKYYAKESEHDTWKHRFHTLLHNMQKPQIVNPNNTNN